MSGSDLTQYVNGTNREFPIAYMNKCWLIEPTNGRGIMHKHLVQSQDLRRSRKITGIILILLIFGFLIQFIGSLHGNSSSVMSDSFHMLVDGSSQLTYWTVLTLIMWGMLAPSWLVKRSLSITNKLKQFDAAILWMIGDVASAIFLFGAGITSIFLALRRLIDPQVVHVEVSFSVAVIGLIINLISMLILLTSGTQDDLIGVFLHVKADLYDSVVVIVGQLVVWNFRDSIEFVQYVDPLLSLWLGKKMIIWAWNLQKTALQGKIFHMKGILIQYPMLTDHNCSGHGHGSEKNGHTHNHHH